MPKVPTTVSTPGASRSRARPRSGLGADHPGQLALVGEEELRLGERRSQALAERLGDCASTSTVTTTPCSRAKPISSAMRLADEVAELIGAADVQHVGRGDGVEVESSRVSVRAPRWAGS